MKKLIIVFIIMVAATITSNAQPFIELGGGINFRDGKYENEGKTKALDFNVSPRVGYQINNNVSAGISFYYYDGSIKNIPTNDIRNGSKTENFRLAAFSRYKLLGMGKFSLLAESSIGFDKRNSYLTGLEKNKLYSESTVAFNIAPVFSYKLSEKLDLIAVCNFLNFGYYYGEYKSNSMKYSFHNFGFNANNTPFHLTIGFKYNF